MRAQRFRSGCGAAYHGRGDFDRAIADYAKAIEIEPKYARAFRNRALTYKARGDLDRTIADYTEAIRIEPKHAPTFSHRGEAYFLKGDLDRALGDFSQAIDLDPREATYFNRRGRAYDAKGDPDRALADYSRAIELDPKYASPYNNRCWLRAMAARDLPLAFSDCETALRLAPFDANNLDSRGFAYLRLNRLDEAIADFDAALRADAKLASSRYGRGLARHRKGDQIGGDADIAAATAMNAGIASEFARYGRVK